MAKKKPATASANGAATPDSSSSINATRGGIPGLIDKVPGIVRSLACLIIIGITAYFCYFVNRGEPPYPFWDENYHMTSGERYVEGLAHLEPHPPLGLLLIAAGEKLTGDNAHIDKHQLIVDKYLNGDKVPAGFSFDGMRLMPSVFGVLTALLFFGFMFSLTENRLHALLFSSFYLFENAYIVHFRAVHLEAFQMFFVVGFLWQFIRLWKRPEPLTWLQYAGMGALAGAAIMVKVNAAVLLALFPILYFKDASTQHRPFTERPADFLGKTATSIVALMLVVFATFTVHGIVGHKLPDVQTSAGQQDIENMSPTYKAYVVGERPMSPAVVMAITTDYFKFMDKDHLGVPKLEVCKPGENGSHPMHWPVMDKTINYRWDSADGLTKYVQLTGNQFDWFLGLAATLFSIILIVNHRLLKLPVAEKKTYHLIEVFTGLYAIFMVLHLYFGTQRVMYLYHYFIGLLLTYVLVVLNWQYLGHLHALSARVKTGIAATIAVLSLATFYFFMPLSDHQPLTHDQCEARNVFMHIVDCQ